MVYRVIGRAGSGKTEYIKTMIGEKLDMGISCVIVVPVQQSMEYEKNIFSLFGSKANLYAEVLTFDRLPNRTYREYGNLATNYIDDGGRALLMANAVANVKDELSEFSGVYEENGFIEKMLNTSKLLKENEISQNALLTVEKNGKVKDKAEETYKILTEFGKLFSDSRKDGCDLLTSYAENLKSMDFFKGKTVFFDSFNSFTEQQHRVIDRIAEQCDEMYISLTYDKDDKSYMFSSSGASYQRLSKHCTAEDIVLVEEKRFKKKSLAFIEESLWNNCASDCENDGGVEFYQCRNKFEEAEAASSAVVKLLNNGMRCKDIVIIARSPESYGGIIESVFEKHGIPCFFSVKDSLLIKPLTVFLISAVEAVAGNYQLPVMQKLLKSGYLPITEKQAELLSRYAETWSIKGKHWISENDYLMNPSGYKNGMTDYETYILTEINEARATVMEIMSAFSDELKAADNGENAAKALYGLLTAVDAASSVRKKSEALRRNGDDLSAQKLTSLWDIIINALDQIYNVCGKVSLTPAKLLKRLQLVFSQYTLGSVPESCDSVVIGNAAVFRGNSPKAVILLGVNDGIFPALPTVKSVFDRDELNELSGIGLYLEDSYELQLDNEKMYFYTACTAASEKLICIYSASGSSRPSVGALRLMRLCNDSVKHVYGDNPEDFIFSPASARENSSYASEKARMMLRKAGLDDTQTVKDYPLSSPEASISTEKKSLLTLSPTILEKYSYCHFSYFGRYVLKLSKQSKASFSHAEIGIFVHKVIEIFVSERMKDGVFVMPTDDEITKRVNDLADDYILSVCGGMAESSKRFKYALTRLKTTLKLLLKNISEEIENSEFKPVGFEVQSNGKEYVTESGMRVKLNGVIDRIDTYVKNGKTYVKVTDYKTGSKVFDRKALDNGLDMQMFLYMFAYCDSDENTFPAAVTYLPAKLECKKTFERPDGEEQTYDSSFKRSGLILNDKEIVESLEKGTKKRFLPVTVLKSGELKSSSSLATAEEFGILQKKTVSCMVKVATLISEGFMNVSPLALKDGYNACEYCDMKEVCRLSTCKQIKRNKGLLNDTEEEE